MTNPEKQEKLYDTVQLAKEIYIRNVADLHTLCQLGDSSETAVSAFVLAEIFILEQTKYAQRVTT